MISGKTKYSGPDDLRTMKWKKNVWQKLWNTLHEGGGGGREWKNNSCYRTCKENRGTVLRSRQTLETFLFFKSIGTSPGPTWPPIQWQPGTLSPEIKWPRCEINTHLHLMPKLRMRSAIPPSYPWLQGEVIKNKVQRTDITVYFEQRRRGTIKMENWHNRQSGRYSFSTPSR
jgi:hypothetical protein